MLLNSKFVRKPSLTSCKRELSAEAIIKLQHDKLLSPKIQQITGNNGLCLHPFTNKSVIIKFYI